MCFMTNTPRQILFIYFFFQVVCYICFFKSLLFADQMTQKLFKLAQKKQECAELK